MQNGSVGLTSFYALDQQSLPERYWELADTFAELHALSVDATGGVHQLAIADLRIVLACCGTIDDGALTSAELAAISRVRATIDGLV